jgi:hypothetical protein
MQFIGKLAGRLIFCLGLMITVVGCVIGSVIGSSSGTTLPGFTLMALGGGIYWFGSTKLCQQCSRRIQHSALECKHCGGAQDRVF